MSEAGEPPAERDWFGGVRPAKAAPTPRPAGEALGHPQKTDAGAGAGGESEWFATDQGSDEAPVSAAEPARASAPAERRAELREVSAGEQAPLTLAAKPAKPAEVRAAAGPVPDLVSALADAASAAPRESAEAPAALGLVPNTVSALPGAADTAREPASPADSRPEPGPVAVAEPAASPGEPAPETDTETDTDSRVRLRALTGGLADLSDALAAIGVESVALRSSGPASPPPAPQQAPAADFRVRCPHCGPQYVAVADLRFVETGDGAEANRYLFTCPACGARVRRPAGPELAEILKSSGVATLALRRGPGQAL